MMLATVSARCPQSFPPPAQCLDVTGCLLARIDFGFENQVFVITFNGHSCLDKFCW
jgi:hypothetical protein